jgi:hypothetical protein
LEKNMNDFATYSLINLPSNCADLSDLNESLSSMTKNQLINLILGNRTPYRTDLRGEPMNVGHCTYKGKGKSCFVVGRNLHGFVGGGNGVSFHAGQLVDANVLMYGSKSAKWASHILECFSPDQLNEIRLVLGRPMSRKDYSQISKHLPTYSGEIFFNIRDLEPMTDFKFAVVKACLDGLSRTKLFKAAA